MRHAVPFRSQRMDDCIRVMESALRRKREADKRELPKKVRKVNDLTRPALKLKHYIFFKDPLNSEVAFTVDGNKFLDALDKLSEEDVEALKERGEWLEPKEWRKIFKGQCSKQLMLPLRLAGSFLSS